MDIYCCVEYTALTQLISPVNPVPQKSPKKRFSCKQDTKAKERARQGGTKEE